MRTSLVGAALLLVAGVQAAQAQASVKPSLFAGLAVPTGDFKTGTSSGYTLGGGLDFGAPLMPVGLRLDASYTNFKSQGGGTTTSDGSGRINLVLPMHMIVATPYMIGGVGYYHVMQDVNNFGNESTNQFGFNVGAGVDFPLGTLAARLEAQYRHVNNAFFTGNESYTYVPITFGLRF